MKSLSAFLVLVAALVLAPVAKADSITFESHIGNHYTYDLTLDSSPTVFFLDGFNLTNLTGVTNAYLTGELAEDFGISFTSTSVSVGTFFDIERSKKVPFSLGTLTVISSAPIGSVNYNVFDSNGHFSGSVLGPDGTNHGQDVPTVPEPSTLMLMGTGLLGAAGAVRRKLGR